MDETDHEGRNIERDGLRPRLKSPVPAEALGQGARLLFRRFPQLIATFGGPGALKASEALLGIVVSALLIRTMSVADFGRFSFLLAVVRLFTLPARIGMGNLLVKEVTREIALGDYAHANGTISWAWRYAILWAIPATVAVSVAYQTSNIAADETFWMATAVTCIAFCIAGPVSGVARAIKRPSISLVPEGLIAPAAFVFVLGAALLLHLQMGVGSALAFRGGLLWIGLLTVYAFLRQLPRMRLIWATRGEADSKRLIRVAIPFTIVSSAILLNQQAGLLLTGFLFDADSVAIYRAGEQFAVILTFAPTVALTVLLPHIAESAQLAPKKDTRLLLRRSMAGAVAISAVMLLVLVFAGEALLTFVYGSQFAASYPILMILGAAWGLNSGAVFAMAFLNMSGSQKPLVAIVALSVALQLVLGPLLGSLFGLNGVAAASGSAILLYSVLVVLRAYRELREEQPAQ